MTRNFLAREDKMASSPDDGGVSISTIGNDALLVVVDFLALPDIALALSVSRAWQGLIDASELTWAAQCRIAWACKVYVPSSLKVLSEGRAAVARAEEEHRAALSSCKVSELKKMIQEMRIQATCVEKKDLVDAILEAEKERAESPEATHTSKLLTRPWFLCKPAIKASGNEWEMTGESYPKAALRLSLVDSKRTCVTEEELTEFEFSIRVRGDGVLHQVKRPMLPFLMRWGLIQLSRISLPRWCR